MPAGPGKYDDLATWVRKKAQARAIVVIVVEGANGSGFSVQTQPGLILDLPALLRRVADDIDAAMPRA
jgi:hypothetical protein